jgi:hypothetical protein
VKKISSDGRRVAMAAAAAAALTRKTWAQFFFRAAEI